MVLPKVKSTDCLSYTEGANPKTATYVCTSGATFQGLKAWREHMVARSMLKKRTQPAFTPHHACVSHDCTLHARNAKA